MNSDEARRLDLAIELAEEALDAYQQLLTPDTRLALRAALVSDLLDTTAGQEMLRSMEADPVVDKSSDVAREPAAGLGGAGGDNGATALRDREKQVEPIEGPENLRPGGY